MPRMVDVCGRGSTVIRRFGKVRGQDVGRTNLLTKGQDGDDHEAMHEDLIGV